MLYSLKKILIKSKSSSYENIWRRLSNQKNYSAISFDIFDTLIKRNVSSPKIVFDILEKRYQKKFKKNISIKRIRSIAEKKARRFSSKNEINIVDIYAEMVDLNKSERKWLLSQELMIETAVCQCNLRIKSIYDWAVKQEDLKVVLTSDMYLPREVIINILENAGYSGWDKLFLSCDENATKSSGLLFKKVLDQLNVKPRSLLHIGDALRGDYLVPKRLGIEAILLDSSNKNTEFLNKKVFKREFKNNEFTYNIINTFTKNNSIGLDYYQKLGFEAIGPILYGYCKWLDNELSKRKITQVYFLAREGVILNRAFNLYNSSKILNNKLIRVSRHATAIPQLYKSKDLEELLSYLNVSRKGYSINKLLNSCNIATSSAISDIESHGFNLNSGVLTLSEKKSRLLFELIFPYIKNESLKQNAYIKKYLTDFKGKVAVGDVGWKGTIQHSLENIFENVRIEGFYLGMKGGKNVKAEAYLFDDRTNLDLESQIMSSVAMFETFFLSTDGTTLGYKAVNENRIIPELGIPEQNNDSIENILKLQNAAFDFVREFKKIDEKLKLQNDPIKFAAAYSEFIDPPTLKEVQKFKNFKSSDNGIHSFVAVHNIFFYFTHMNKFISEFLNSGNKALFLKSVFKIPLPYVSIVQFLRKFDK